MSDEFHIIELEATIIAERALADDLAAVLDKYADLFAGVTGQTTVEAEQVLARYREARQR